MIVAYSCSTYTIHPTTLFTRHDQNTLNLESLHFPPAPGGDCRPPHDHQPNRYLLGANGKLGYFTKD